MPLKKAANHSKKACQAAVKANMHELKHNGKRPRSLQQRVAISLNAAGCGRKRKKS